MPKFENVGHGIWPLRECGVFFVRSVLDITIIHIHDIVKIIPFLSPLLYVLCLHV